MWIVSDSLEGPKRGRLKRAYSEAISQLLNDVEGGEDVQLLGSTKGGVRQIIWISAPLADRLDAFCKGRAFKNDVLITAVARYLKSKIGRAG